jgi:hypothetical protein
MARGSFLNGIFHSRMLLDPMPAHLKLLHACDQQHAYKGPLSYRLTLPTTSKHRRQGLPTMRLMVGYGARFLSKVFGQDFPLSKSI